MIQEIGFDRIFFIFIENLKKQIINAVKLNENKGPILKKVIEYLNAMAREGDQEN